MRNTSSWASAISRAANPRAGAVGSDTSICLIRPAFAAAPASNVSGRDKPWLSALRLDLARPPAVLGPVLFFAFSRFARSCFSVAMPPRPPTIFSSFSGFPSPANTLVFLTQFAAAPLTPRCHGLEHLDRVAVLLRGFGLQNRGRDPISANSATTSCLSLDFSLKYLKAKSLAPPSRFF